MKPKKILIVEDEDTSRDIIALSVGTKGRELIFAKDGDEAIQVAVREQPDLIIMDVMLPKLNGFQATQILKQKEETKHIPVVAITARTGNYDEEMGREAGCDDFITKPFRVAHLRERLYRFLED
jgi:two-component system cell cycle response regulator DivK